MFFPNHIHTNAPINGKPGGGGGGRPGIGRGFDVTSLPVTGTFDHSLSCPPPPCHNVATIINDITYALYTGWVAKLNLQVSLPNDLSAGVVIASSFL